MRLPEGKRKAALLAVTLATALLAVCVVAAVPQLAQRSAPQADPAGTVKAGSSAAEAAPSDRDNLVNPQQTPDSSFLYDTSIANLGTADSYLYGQRVKVFGVVVGYGLRAEDDSDFCWLLLLSTQSPNDSVFVYLSRTLTQSVEVYGAYGKRGTMLQVRGVFNLACPVHDGLTDLHADHAAVVAKGSEEPDPFDPVDFVPGLALMLVAAGLAFAFWRLRESDR